MSKPSQALMPLVAAIAVACFAPYAAAQAAPAGHEGHAPQAASAAKGAVKRFVLQSNIVDGKMVFVNDKGVANPTLRAEVGDTVEFVLSSGEGAEHDIAVAEFNAISPKVSNGKPAVTLRFKVTQPGKFSYYCTIPGHRQIGMEGTLEVTGQAQANAVPAQTDATQSALSIYTPASQPTKAANAAAVSVAQDPNAVPAPIGARGPVVQKIRMETVELDGKLGDGTTFTYWTFDRKVPGPMIRAKVGDTIELTLANAKDSKMIHSIDLHAVTGGHGGGEHTQVAPGTEKTITFKVLNPGLFVYHCATPLVPQHIAAGMYGMILVEPEQGLPKVEREFYVMQGDMYTHRSHGTKGHLEPDLDKMGNELPDYYVFNGQEGALTKTHKMTAKVGDTVRIFFGVGGPNKISSFHVIGEIFDKVYSEASLSAVKTSVQTTLVAPGGATIAEFQVQHPGTYVLVDHALSRAGKGAVGILEVTGPGVPGVYKVGKN